MIPLQRYVDDGSGPSHKELWKKIEAARRLISEGDWKPVCAVGLNEDFDRLGEAFDIDAYSEEGQLSILATALDEIRADNFWPKGAKTSIALPTVGMKLWTFRWKSEKECFGKSVMYVKFCIIGTGEQGPVHIHSIHVDNPPPTAEEESASEE